jgi:hypothetical protein
MHTRSPLPPSHRYGNQDSLNFRYTFVFLFFSMDLHLRPQYLPLCNSPRQRNCPVEPFWECLTFIQRNYIHQAHDLARLQFTRNAYFKHTISHNFKIAYPFTSSALSGLSNLPRSLIQLAEFHHLCLLPSTPLIVHFLAAYNLTDPSIPSNTIPRPPTQCSSSPTSFPPPVQPHPRSNFPAHCLGL